MRASEFLTESKLSDVHDALEISALALPSTYIIPELKNQDFYKQYRFGVAIAAVRGDSGNDDVRGSKINTFSPESKWNEDQIVVSFDPGVGEVIDKALAKLHMKGSKKQVSSAGSEEMPDTDKQSPVKPFKGYGK